MPTRELLAPSQRAQFTDFTAPLDDRTLARFYTLSDTDLELIRRHRRDSTQLGFAVQLGYARYNAVLGENFAFVHQGWMGAEEIAAWVRALPQRANSGDIYARLPEPRA